MIRTLAVVGTGLIGTSVALAASRHGITVHLLDRDEAAARTAAALGAGVVGRPAEPADLAVLAVPPGQVAACFAEQYASGLARSYTDVASVKSEPQRGVLDSGADPACFIGGHPMGGRERSGPLAARAGLFEDRPWVLTPSADTSTETFNRALSLAALCGAVPVVMDAERHDEVVALTSHAPHVVASLLAARLDNGPDEVTRLAGQGLRDTTRIAAGETRLWGDILRSNASAVAGVLRGLHDDLAVLLAALESMAEQQAGQGAVSADSLRAVEDLLDRGIAGLDRIGGRPAVPVLSTRVEAVIPDRPGELSRLLDAAGELGVGTELAEVGASDDPGTLAVRFTVARPAGTRLLHGLRQDGWVAA